MAGNSLHGNWAMFVHVLCIIAFLSKVGSRNHKTHYRYDVQRTTSNKFTKTMCMNMDNTLRARHRSCFLRPDTGPCRADVIQWYFDVKHSKCYRFFWGGCQGNGNKFESKAECYDYCYMNSTYAPVGIPQYCQLTFDYGTCFGHYNRWGWDKLTKTCKRRLYSGCGGNQNNFETQGECMKTCLLGPGNIHENKDKLTTCIPLNMNLQ